jgi:hypothetical protein
MYTGTIGQYKWIEWRDENDDLLLSHLFTWLKPLVIGFYAVNTSYDSGHFSPTACDIQAGWSVRNGFAVSPPVTETLPDSFFDMEYSEWYLFQNMPRDFPTRAFCNWCGLSVAERADVAFHHDFEADIHRCLPEIVVGEGKFLYLIYKPSYHQRILAALPDTEVAAWKACQELSSPT